jgi:hypothetical protein
MLGRCMKIVLGAALVAGCATADREDEGAVAVADSARPAAPAAAVGCAPQTSRMPLAGRASPYDSVAVPLGDARGVVCYGRPSVLGRTIFGDLIPFGRLWRTGANEPTTIHLPVAARIAGVAVEPGSYSLYTVPGEKEWTIIVNRSVSQWGIEAQYTEQIAAQEVGRAVLPAERTASPVETFSITANPAANGAELVLEWENTRVRIPITRG